MDPQGATKSAKDLAKEEKKEEKKRKEEEKKAEKKRKEEEKKNQKAEKKERKSSVKKRPSGCNSITTHTKALSKVYEGFGIDKFEVPPEKAGWAVPFPEYAPTDFTTKLILETKPVWADPDIADKEAFDKINFNVLDGPTNRCSFVKEYTLVDGVPQNPVGRTGIKGRGTLGKWGPNHAADPIVTRWKRDANGKKVKHESGKYILEFVCIQRRDTKEWAIPGGMVNADEEVSLTLKREFGEEALNTLEESQKAETKKSIEKVFKSGEIIYKGYVDDPRNTDNAWMETVASNFHDDSGKTVGKIPLSAGDDAQAVRWLSIDGPLELFASHAFFIEQVCAKHKAFFVAAPAK